MASGNEWINGYLEAILDAGTKLRGQQQGQALTTAAALPRLLADAGPTPAPAPGAAVAYSPTRYFVEEVVSRFDDRDLHKTWTKVRNAKQPLAIDRSASRSIPPDGYDRDMT